MNRRNLLLLALSALSCLSFTGCSTQKKGLCQEGVLKVGMECAYAPFNWTEAANTDSNVAIANVNGSYADGYDVQVAKRIASDLNLTLEVYALDWDALIPSLTSNQIDLIIAGMSPTAERKETIDFTDGYYKSTHVLLVNANGNYTNAKTLSDFANAKVVGQAGTLYADLVPQVTAKSAGATEQAAIDTVPQIVTGLIANTYDVTILEEPVAKGICAQYPNQFTYITPTDGFDVAEEDVVVSIGVRKGFKYTAQINNSLTNTITQTVRNQLMEQAIANAPAEE